MGLGDPCEMNSSGKCCEPDMSISILGCSAFLELERCLEASEGLTETGVHVAVPPSASSQGSASNNVSDLDLFDSGGTADSGVKQKHSLADVELPKPKEAKLDAIDNDGAQVDSGERSEHVATDNVPVPGDSPVLQDAQATGIHVPIEAQLVSPRDDDGAVPNIIVAEGSAPAQPIPYYPLGRILRPLVSAKPEFCSDNFLRGCKWSPDGTCVLVCSNDNRLRLYNLPVELYSGVVKGLPDMDSALTVAEGDGVYDFCWFPQMSSADPTTCCFATCCKDHPIHLWDAFYGHNRCSYVAYNHMDEVIAPYSLAFSLDGEKLYAGFLSTVKIFQTCRPGRSCENKPTFEKKHGGQSGMVSCIAVHPTQQGTYAVGSYARSIGLYADSAHGPIFVLQDTDNAITHLQFSLDGQCLFSGARKSNLIQCWDLRQPGTVLYTFQREVTTNQRVFFDLYSNGRFLLSGGTNGCLYSWDLENLVVDTNGFVVAQNVFQVHKDAASGCSVHPSLPLLATCSGQRKFLLSRRDRDSESEEEEECETFENSFKIWSLLGTQTGLYSEILAQSLSSM